MLKRLNRVAEAPKYTAIRVIQPHCPSNMADGSKGTYRKSKLAARTFIQSQYLKALAASRLLR